MSVLLEPEELDMLVAPVALYPDALLAQVLVAATHRLQVAKADQLIAPMKGMGQDVSATGDAVTNEAQEQQTY